MIIKQQGTLPQQSAVFYVHRPYSLGCDGDRGIKFSNNETILPKTGL